MRTGYLLGAAYPILAVLGFGPDLPGVSAVLCLAVLLITGELWLRALVRGPVGAAARLGLATAAGLVTLPLVSLALYAFGVRIEVHALAVGVALVVTVLGGHALVPPAPVAPRPPVGTLVAVVLPTVLALVVGGGAVLIHRRLPQPADPGYTSLALGGWAADIRRPVAIPPGGLEVPIRISSVGLPPATAPLRVHVGARQVGLGRPVTIAPDSTQSVQVHVPAPPGGCLQRIEISLGTASTVFYGHGPAAC